MFKCLILNLFYAVLCVCGGGGVVGGCVLRLRDDAPSSLMTVVKCGESMAGGLLVCNSAAPIEPLI